MVVNFDKIKQAPGSHNGDTGGNYGEGFNNKHKGFSTKWTKTKIKRKNNTKS